MSPDDFARLMDAGMSGMVRIQQMMINEAGVDPASLVDEFRDCLQAVVTAINAFQHGPSIVTAHQMMQYTAMVEMLSNAIHSADSYDPDDFGEDVPRGYDERHIEYYTKLIKLSSYRNTRAQLCCTVCQEDFAGGCSVRRLRCDHIFHDQCIRPWLALRKTCPVCVVDICTPSPPDKQHYLKRLPNWAAHMSPASPRIETDSTGPRRSRRLRGLDP